jgi:hypothetical protein
MKPTWTSSTRPPEKPTTATGVAVAEPETEATGLTLRAFIAEEYREGFIEIYTDAPERHLVTCIEVLSPSNKRKGSLGWEQYLRKRQGLLLGAANLVEIDLLRGGQRMPMLDPWPNSPYTLLVARRHRSPYCRVFPAHFRRPLPPIPGPPQPDADVTLTLRPLIEAVCDVPLPDDIDYTCRCVRRSTGRLAWCGATHAPAACVSVGPSFLLRQDVTDLVGVGGRFSD